MLSGEKEIKIAMNSRLQGSKNCGREFFFVIECYIKCYGIYGDRSDDPRCFEMLANAIVKQAAVEYRNARRILIRMPNAVPPKEKIQDVEK